jgi:hypothetical protein
MALRTTSPLWWLGRSRLLIMPARPELLVSAPSSERALQVKVGRVTPAGIGGAKRNLILFSRGISSLGAVQGALTHRQTDGSICQ